MTLNIEEALNLIESGQVEKGLELLKTSLTESDDESKYNAALLLQEWGFIQDALAIALELKKRYHDDSQIILMLSELYIDLDEEEKAIDLLLQVKKSDDSYLSAQLLLADLYQLQGLDEVAEQKLLAAHFMAPNEPILTFALGEFYLSTGQAAKAIPMYEAVLHEEVLNHENIQLKLAEALSLNGFFEEALPYYKNGLKINKSLDALFGYGMTAYQLEKYSTVIAALEELKELDPHYSTLYAILADAYKEEGALEESLSVLEEGIKQDEFNDRLLLDAGKLSLQVGKTQQGVNYLEELLKHDPDNIEGLLLLVDHYDQLELFDEIIHVLQNKQHDDPRLMWTLAKAYLEEDEIDQAIKYYKDVYTNFHQNASFLQQYGECQLQLGHNKEALELFKQALTFDPINDELIGLIERLEYTE